MASKTKRTSSIRKKKLHNKGKKRKARLKNHGTTKSPKELFGDK